jgi:hypothetical protein
MKRIDLFLKSSVDTEKLFSHLSEAAFLEDKSQRPKRNLKAASAVERIPGTLLSRTENFFFQADCGQDEKLQVGSQGGCSRSHP